MNNKIAPCGCLTCGGGCPGDGLCDGRPRERGGLLTEAERHLGFPIRDIRDREAYVALGRANSTPGASDPETLAWARDATIAKVADSEFDENSGIVLGWIRLGESERI